MGVDLNAFMSEHTGRTVHVVNDADAAGLAEAQFGAAKNSEGACYCNNVRNRYWVRL